MKKIYLSALFSCVIALIAQAQCFKDLTDPAGNVVAYTARGNISGAPASEAFDNSYDCTNSAWNDNLNVSSSTPSWIKVQFSVARIITAYAITVQNGSRNSDPRDWLMQASNDNSTWVGLQTRSNQTFSSSGETRFYTFSNSTAYIYYRLRVTETFSTSSTNLIIAEMQLIDDIQLSGYVFKDDGDEAYNMGSNDTAFNNITVSIINKNNTVVDTDVTDGSGYFNFSSSDLVNVIGDFSIVITPPVNYVFVSEMAPMFRAGLSLPTAAYQSPTGCVMFACNRNAQSNTIMVNRFLFGTGSFNVTTLNFGMKKSIPSKLVAALGYGFTFPQNNLITDVSNGTFGTWAATFPAAHPMRPGFTDGVHSDLYYTIGSNSSYVFNNNTNSPVNGPLWPEGDYLTTSFHGTIQDIATGNNGAYQGSLLNEYPGGWVRSYGATTADAYDMFLALNGSPAGTTDVFRTSPIALWPNEEYVIVFNAKGANSYVQQQNGLGVNQPTIVLEVKDASSNIIYSANKSFNYSNSPAEDKSYYQWDQVTGAFTATANGPFIVNIRASTTAAEGNDAYIDNISLFHARRIDFGDSPASFGTNSTYHLIYPAIMMGTITIDSNKVANAGSSANGDDTQLGDDEDGVSYFPALTLSTTSYSVDVSAFNNYGVTANLCGWVDFNGNGVFNGFEGYCTTVADGFNGTKTMTWTTLNPVSTTYARFRLTTEALTVNDATGRASDGEIEDYWLNDVLPIELASFMATVNAFNQVDLLWSTESEQNSNYFRVMRSADGINFQEIGQVKAAGYSTFIIRYYFTDALPLTGTSFYKLIFVDLDGSTTESMIRSVYIYDALELDVTVSGVAIGDILNFSLKGNFETAEVEVMNILGNRLWSSNEKPGSYSVVLDHWPAGMYFIHAYTPNGIREVKRFIIR